jgi:hypothetical protein
LHHLLLLHWHLLLSSHLLLLLALSSGLKDTLKMDLTRLATAESRLVKSILRVSLSPLDKARSSSRWELNSKCQCSSSK